MIQFNRYSPADNDPARLAAINARKHLWGQNPLCDVPPLKKMNYFYKQEIVACLGMELACLHYKLTDQEYFMYLGFTHDDDELHSYVPQGTMLYQPRDSGFFSVIENLIVAKYVARINNKQLIVDNTYDWWGYEEPFGDIFREFTLVDRVPASPQAIHFESMRNFIFTATNETMEEFYKFKIQMYKKILRDIRWFYRRDEVYNVDRAGVIFLRGGDKLEAETILPPMELLMRDVHNLSRRVSRRLVLSDDYVLAERIVDQDDGVTNITPFGQRGYRHRYGEKVSCMPILKNYIALVDCTESLACPSANLVNAAHWSRPEGMSLAFDYNTINPVYRYALI